MAAPLIEFKDVTKRFGEKTVLDRVNLQVYEGEITTVVGLSGGGKTVLLKHIIGLLKPDEGTILFRGEPLGNRRAVKASASQMSYMFQGNALFDSMTVYENIALPLREKTSLRKLEIERRVSTRMEQMELGDAADKYPSELSGGMQKRVALARALVTEPRIVLFDEPTSGQDPVRKNAILSMIAQYQRKFGFTAVLVSHEIPDVFFISERILVLYHGSIVFQGSPEELDAFDHPVKDEVIRSLEGLEDELTGLHSRRHFKVQYHNLLNQRSSGEAYSVVVFILESPEAITAALGHEATQEAIRNLAFIIDRHFSAMGGFSSRRRFNEFITVLPYSDREETDRLLKEFAADFQGRGIRAVWPEGSDRRGPAPCLEVKIKAGIAEGQPLVEGEALIDTARSREDEVIRLQCP